MKHRSVHIFILLAALLAAGPQASKEISKLKTAAVECVRAEILSAFLGLQSSEGVTQTAPQAANALLASSPASDDSTAGAAKKGNSQARQSTRVEVTARREVPAEVSVEVEVPAEVAMLGVPELSAEKKALPPAVSVEGLVKSADLAMLTHPSDGFVPSTRVAAAGGRKAEANRRQREEVYRQLAGFAARYAEWDEKLKSDDELPRALEALGRDAEWKVEFRRAPAKVIKKRAAAPAPAPAAACAPLPARQLACSPFVQALASESE